MKPIDKKELMKYWQDKICWDIRCADCPMRYEDGRCKIEQYFEEQPIVDAMPVVHGEWIHGKELSRAYVGNCCVGISYEDFRCSACGITVEECEKPKWKYCPNCGARMDGEEL